MENIDDQIAAWRALPDTARQDARRLLHGRGGTCPGLSHVAIDWFDPVVLITLYADHREISPLVAALPVSEFPNIAIQRRHLHGAPIEQVRGSIPTPHYAVEAGLKFELQLATNQNHGFFLDMRNGRNWLRERAAGKRVLNLFAYTCSFSVVALVAGADEVVNLDMAKGALNTGRKNHRLNLDDESTRRATFLKHDLFKSWGKLRRLAPFDIIIVDPPSLQRGAFEAERDYPKVIRRLADLATSQDAAILACLNSPHLGQGFLRDHFAKEAPEFRLEQRLPEADGFPELAPDRGVKAIVFSR